MNYEVKNMMPREFECTDEYVYKMLVKQVVDNMALADLEKIFKLTKIDPISADFTKDSVLIGDLYDLKSKNCILYKVKINIP